MDPGISGRTAVVDQATAAREHAGIDDANGAFMPVDGGLLKSLG